MSIDALTLEVLAAHGGVVRWGHSSGNHRYWHAVCALNRERWMPGCAERMERAQTWPQGALCPACRELL